MPNIIKLQFSQILCNTLITADVKDFFKSLHVSIPTSLTFLQLSLRTKEGLPTCRENIADGTGLHTLRYTRNSYGISDLPILSSTAISNCISDFKKYSTKAKTYPNWLLEEINHLLTSQIYCDDLIINIKTSSNMKYVKENQIKCPTTPRSLTTNFINEYKNWISKI